MKGIKYGTLTSLDVLWGSEFFFIKIGVSSLCFYLFIYMKFV